MAEQQNLAMPAWAGKPITQANLVLEGGAMRGQFSAGVIDYFLQHGLFLNHVIGVSAGALVGYCYKAGEVGRTCFLNMKYAQNPHYLSFRSLFTTGNIYGRKLAFHDIPEKLDQFNFDAFYASPIKLTAVSSNLETGEADYHDIEDLSENADLPYLVASSSMPIVSQIVNVDSKQLLDGGTCDSVPIEYSKHTGAKKHVVVLTQHESYVKPPMKLMPIARQMYSNYPYFLERMEHRHIEYNRLYKRLAQMHASGEIFVIAPAKPVEISNMEHNQDKLLDLYCQGYEQAALNWGALQHYLHAQ